MKLHDADRIGSIQGLKHQLDYGSRLVLYFFSQITLFQHTCHTSMSLIFMWNIGGFVGMLWFNNQI